MEVLQVEGRDAVRLKSGRVVWRDEKQRAFGEFLAPLRPWSLFGTFTYDRARHAQWLASLRKRSGYRDGGAEVVSVESTLRHFARLVRQVEGYVGHRVDYYAGVEFQKDGWPHVHSLIDVGPVHFGDIAKVGGFWYDAHGGTDLQIPRSLEDVAEYVAKYVTKEYGRGDFVLSPGLARPPAYQLRSRVLTRR